MTVESNYVIAIATLSDWLKRLAPVFQPGGLSYKPGGFLRSPRHYPQL